MDRLRYLNVNKCNPQDTDRKWVEYNQGSCRTSSLNPFLLEAHEFQGNQIRKPQMTAQIKVKEVNPISV